MRKVRLAFALAAAVTTAGCIEMQEEVRVNADGTARYSLDIAMPEFLIAGVMKEAGDSTGGSISSMMRGAGADTTNDSLVTREFVEGDLHHFAQERSLQSLAHLVALSNFARQDTSGPERLEHVMPGFEIAAVGEGRTRLRRIVFPKGMQAAASGEPADGSGVPPSPEKAAETRASLFAGRHYRFKLHAPRIVSTNGVLSKDGKLVEWTFPMADAMGDTVRVLEAVLERE